MSVRTPRRSRGVALCSGREVAVRVLERVERDGAFASVGLDAELGRHPGLDSRERALAAELTYGCLRTGPAIEARLRTLAPRGIAGDDRRVRLELVVAAYQILFLDRVPAHAAVDAAVGALRRQRGGRVAGFANAVLRRLSVQPPPLSFAAAVVESCPTWLRARLAGTLGDDAMLSLLGARSGSREGTGPPPLGALSLRLLEGRDVPDWLADARSGLVSPRCRWVVGRGDPRSLGGYAEGAFVVQEEGAQLVGLALGARPGERVLDACAGRGQKTSLLREQVGPEAQLWATDYYPAKLGQLETEFARLALAPPVTQAVDLTAGCGTIPDQFDRVLVDAPCTGVGTLRRRPEIARRLAPEDPARLGELAVRILRRSASRARPGGRVVFAVCSVLPEECEQVVEGVLDVLEPIPFDAPEVARVAPPGATSVRLVPAEHGTDGYFVASFQRRPA